MKNLAGNRDCDKYIRDELERAGIEIVYVELADSEVPYRLIGKLGDITFRRAWYYWMVDCKVPLKIAQVPPRRSYRNLCRCFRRRLT